MKDNIKIIYTPKGPIREGYSGPFLTTRLMFRELTCAKELIWRFFLRDFNARYRQSVLGILWILLTPLVAVGMFVCISRAGIITIQDIGIPYPLYAIVGLSIWNLFTVGLTASTNSLINSGSMIVKINFPKVALVLAASGQGVVDFLIRSILIFILFIYYGVTPNWGGVFIGLICIIPTYVITISMGFVLSLVAGVIRDIANVLSIALMGVMLLTPILYPITGNSFLARANIWNPFNYLINVPRDFIFKGYTPFFSKFMLTTLLSLILFYLCWRLFYMAQTKIAERI